MTNRKSYMAYQMAQTQVTLNDLEGHFSYLRLTFWKIRLVARSFISFRAFEMLVVYICAALYKISTDTPASRGPSATAGLLVDNDISSSSSRKRAI